MTNQITNRLRVGAVLAVGAAVTGTYLPAALPAASAAAATCQTSHAGDSTGDGRADPVVGVPGKNRVVLFHGSKHGIVPAGSIEGGDVGNAGGGFGTTVAQGDINGDHCADAAIATGGDRLVVVYAKPGLGLHTTGAQSLGADSMGYPLTCDCVRFLDDPTFGDFNGDGYDDLALVVRDYSPDNDSETLALIVVPGSATGARPGESRVLALDGQEIPFTSKVLRDPYLSLASGDVDADGRADLAIDISNSVGYGTTGQHPGPVDHGDVDTHPVVDVIYGSDAGLGQGRSTQVWDRESPGVPGSDLSRVAASTAAFGRFNHDRYEDLAIVVPYEKAVVVLYGQAGGLRSEGVAVLTLPGSFADTATRATTADFDADHDDELVVSAANAKKHQHLFVFRGTRHGLIGKHLQVWTQHTAGLPPRRLAAGVPDGLGSVLRSGFYGRGAGEDLLISDSSDATNSGSVTELFGSAKRGLTTRHATRFTQATTGVPGSPTGSENFGA